jgi:hypothetical protein
MKPRTPAEELIAQTLAEALRGQLKVGPLDLMKLAAAAREVEPGNIALLALERWMSCDPRAATLLRKLFPGPTA